MYQVQCFKTFGKEVASNFYSIPTSKIAYEFTRKVYTLLELDIKLTEVKVNEGVTDADFQ